MDCLVITKSQEASGNTDTLRSARSRRRPPPHTSTLRKPPGWSHCATLRVNPSGPEAALFCYEKRLGFSRRAVDRLLRLQNRTRAAPCGTKVAPWSKCSVSHRRTRFCRTLPALRSGLTAHLHPEVAGSPQSEGKPGSPVSAHWSWHGAFETRPAPSALRKCCPAFSAPVTGGTRRPRRRD